jgi:hypothetical protein
MKKLFTLLLLFICLTIQATTYYVRTDGNNSHSGTTNTSAGAWASLYYACAHATNSGDIIHVAAGTYTETQECDLAVGVSIIGDGLTTHIKSHYFVEEYGWLIQAYSATQGTNGNQSISYIWLDGDGYQGYGGIETMGRSNVTVNNCTISGFYGGAIFMCGADGKPTTYATGLVVHDCRLIDDATCESGGYELFGILDHGGTVGFQCYNTTIYQPDRGANITGGCLKQAKGGFVSGSHFYNDSIITAPLVGSMWSGAAEFFDCLGGIEIDHSVIQGTLDFSCNLPGAYGTTQDLSLQDAGSYGFALKVHDNKMMYTGYRDFDESEIDIERNAKGGIYIYNNYFENVGFPIQFSYDNGGGSGSSYLKQDIYIYYNIFYDIGAPTDPSFGSAINVETGTLSSNDEIRNFYVENNVFRAGALAGPKGAITTLAGGKWTNTYIRNNIFTEWPVPVSITGATINTMSVENNDFYGNTSNSNSYSGCSITGKTEQNNLTSNPLYIGGSPYSYHLSSASPCINSGIHLTLPTVTTDYAGVTIGNPPEIGVYEYGSISIPSVTTASVSNITTSTGISGGNVASDGGAAVTARGICWSISANPTILNSPTTNDGTGIGSYVSNAANMLSNTTYHIRAYATNSQGTNYGADIAFNTLAVTTIPSITTTSVSNITTTTASTGGTVTSDGGANITTKGICWNISSNPTISNSHTSDGTGTGTFVSLITGLTSATIYHVRAYAINSVGTAYGVDMQFTTSSIIVAPTVTTTSVSGVTISTASTGGIITSDGGGSVTARGVVYSTSSNPVISGNHTSDGTGTGTFISNLTGLIPGTLYYVRAYAINSTGISYGSQVSFMTTSNVTIPVLLTTIWTSVTPTTAIMGGNISSDGGASVTARGVCWGTAHLPTTALSTKTSNGTGMGVFTSNLTGLTSGTAYYVRAYATNSQGTAYGQELMVVTGGNYQVIYP